MTPADRADGKANFYLQVSSRTTLQLKGLPVPWERSDIRQPSPQVQPIRLPPTTLPALVFLAALLDCSNRLASFRDHTVGEKERVILTGSSVPPLDFMACIPSNWIK